jgi:hypothetical protein
MVYETEEDIRARLLEIEKDKDRPRNTLIDKLNDWFKEIYPPDYAIATVFPPGLLYENANTRSKEEDATSDVGQCGEIDLD